MGSHYKKRLGETRRQRVAEKVQTLTIETSPSLVERIRAHVERACLRRERRDVNGEGEDLGAIIALTNNLLGEEITDDTKIEIFIQRGWALQRIAEEREEDETVIYAQFDSARGVYMEAYTMLLRMRQGTERLWFDQLYRATLGIIHCNYSLAAVTDDQNVALSLVSEGITFCDIAACVPSDRSELQQLRSQGLSAKARIQRNSGDLEGAIASWEEEGSLRAKRRAQELRRDLYLADALAVARDMVPELILLSEKKLGEALVYTFPQETGYVN